MNSQARLAELRLRGMVEYQQTPGDKAIAAKATKVLHSQQRTSKLMSRQEAILKKYLASVGSRAVMEFDDLPANVRSALEAVKDQETLWSDVNRWLGDNAPNPYTQHPWGLSRRVNLASQGEQATSLYQQIQRIASEYPETRAYLVPLLKSWATR